MYSQITSGIKALHGSTPVYIKDMIKRYQPVRELRSSHKNLLVPCEFNLKSYGRHAFSVAAPYLWNSLPEDIKNSSCIDIFKHKLKTFLLNLHSVHRLDSFILICIVLINNFIVVFNLFHELINYFEKEKKRSIICKNNILTQLYSMQGLVFSYYLTDINYCNSPTRASILTHVFLHSVFLPDSMASGSLVPHSAGVQLQQGEAFSHTSRELLSQSLRYSMALKYNPLNLD